MKIGWDLDIINIHAESSSNISRRMEIYILMHLKKEPGTWNLELGTWNLEPGTWNLELGKRQKATENRKKATENRKKETEKE